VEKLISRLAIGVGAIFVVSAGFALGQELLKNATLQTLTLNDVSIDQAMLVAQGAIAECKKDNSVVTVAVVDRNGGVRFVLRGDGASPQDVENARKKAYTARTFRQATSVWMERTAPDQALNGQRALEDTIAQKGGMPIIWHGDAIGGVGVAGSKGGEDNDEVCAKAGVQAIADQLL
jgi:uncharacterized protein GlcG (DUF336 family)